MLTAWEGSEENTRTELSIRGGGRARRKPEGGAAGGKHLIDSR